MHTVGHCGDVWGAECCLKAPKALQLGESAILVRSINLQTIPIPFPITAIRISRVISDICGIQIIAIKRNRPVLILRVNSFSV